MCKWDSLKIGDNLMFCGEAFDGRWSIPCEITGVENDHAIALADNGSMLWIDDDTQYQFKEVA